MDNRLVLATEEQLHKTWMQQFTDFGFYGNQIRLEKVDDHSWLGFTIAAASRSIQYKAPTQQWQVRSFASAGFLRLRVAGLLSQCALIRKYTRPTSQIHPSIAALRQLYIEAGFPDEVLPSVSKLSKLSNSRLSVT